MLEVPGIIQDSLEPIHIIFVRQCKARASRTESVRCPSLVRPSFRIPSKILNIQFPACHVFAVAVKTGLFVH